MLDGLSSHAACIDGKRDFIGRTIHLEEFGITHRETILCVHLVLKDHEGVSVETCLDVQLTRRGGCDSPPDIEGNQVVSRNGGLKGRSGSVEPVLRVVLIHEGHECIRGVGNGLIR